MEVLRKNREEDQKFLVFLGKSYEGERFRIVFSTGKFGERYVCMYDGTEYKNCEKVDATHVLCKLDRHGLSCGLVEVEVTVWLDDPQMGDENYKLNEKGLLEVPDEGVMKHVELTDGKSDIISTPEVTFELLSNVIKGKPGDPMTWDKLTEEQKLELKGDPGLSAYGVWLEQGNEGSVDDFLASMRGKDGDPGKDGKDGNVLYPTMRVDASGHLIIMAQQDPHIKIDKGHLKIEL